MFQSVISWIQNNSSSVENIALTLIMLAVLWWQSRGIRNTFQKLWESVSERVRAVENRLGVVESRIDLFTKTDSPLELTDKGKKLAEEAGAYQLAEQYRSRAGVVGEDDEYQVQEKCIAFASHELGILIEKENAAAIPKIHKAAYENGTSKAVVYRLTGLIMREKILAERKKQN